MEGDSGGAEGFEGLPATRCKADFSRFLDFLLLGFVFAIVMLGELLVNVLWLGCDSRSTCEF
jgi:hypothetical protein